jgi:asparagine synthase (glutamine-hydrolysing)
MGFAIPIGDWFRTDFGGLRGLLLDHLHSAEPFGPFQIQRSATRRLLHEHMSGHRDHGHRLFTLLTLSIWARSA